MRLKSCFALGLLCVGLMSCAPALRGWEPKISGQVTDLTTGDPVAGAKVFYGLSSSVNALTDEQGRFVLTDKDFVEAWKGKDLDDFVRATKAGYFPGDVYKTNAFNGDSPNKHWTINIGLLPESHPLAPYIRKLKNAMDSGKGYDAWVSVLLDMRRAGFSRKDARAMLEHVGYIFENLPKDTRALHQLLDLYRETGMNSNIWPADEAPKRAVR